MTKANSRTGPGRPPKENKLIQISSGVPRETRSAVREFQLRQGFRSESNAVAELLRRVVSAGEVVLAHRRADEITVELTVLRVPDLHQTIAILRSGKKLPPQSIDDIEETWCLAHDLLMHLRQLNGRAPI
jgi:hypothetical protein